MRKTIIVIIFGVLTSVYGEDGHARNGLFVREINFDGISAVEMGNGIIRLVISKIGARIIVFEPVDSGEAVGGMKNIYYLDRDGMRAYQGNGQPLSSGEKEILLAGSERWPLGGLWDQPSLWRVVMNDGECLSVEFTLKGRDMGLGRKMTIRKNESAFDYLIECVNLGAERRDFAPSSHPEMVVGGRAQKGDVILCPEDGEMKVQPYEPQKIGVAYFCPESGVWAAHDETVNETVIRSFPADQVEKLYVYNGPDFFNMEEINRTLTLEPCGKSATWRRVCLIDGMPAVGDIADGLAVALVPKQDLIGENGELSCDVWIGSSKPLATARISMKIGRDVITKEMNLPQPGKAEVTRLEIPVSILGDGKNKLAGTVTINDSTKMNVKATVVKDEKQWRRLRSMMENVLVCRQNTGEPLSLSRNRDDIRDHIAFYRVRRSVDKVVELKKRGCYLECLSVLESNF